PRLAKTRIARAESVAAVVGLLRAVGAVDPGEPGARHEEYLGRDLHQLARERRDDRRGGVRIRFRVGGAVDAKDVAGVLEQRVLEAAAGAEEGAPVLAGVADGEQRAGLAPVGGRRDAPDSLTVHQRASVEPPGERLGADPLTDYVEAERCTRERERPGNRLMRGDGGVVVPDERDADGGHAASQRPARMLSGQATGREAAGLPQSGSSSRRNGS